MDAESSADRNRGAGLLGIAGQNFLREACDLPAEILLEHGGGFLIPENMDREALRAGAGEHDDALGIDHGEPEVPNLLHGLGALAGPSEHVHAPIQAGTAWLGDPALLLLVVICGKH